jgi:hypothetical protein
MAEITTTITNAYEDAFTLSTSIPTEPVEFTNGVSEVVTVEDPSVASTIAVAYHDQVPSTSTFVSNLPPLIPTGPVEFTNGVSEVLPENPAKLNTLENVYSSSESGHSEEEESEEENDEESDEENENESDTEDEEDDMCIREEDKEDPAEHIYLVTVDNKVVKYHESRETAMELLSLIKNGIVVNHCGQYTVSVDELASGFDIHLTSKNILFRQTQTRVLRVLKIYRAEI